jgi:hypothetical protein
VRQRPVFSSQVLPKVEDVDPGPGCELDREIERSTGHSARGRARSERKQ